MTPEHQQVISAVRGWVETFVAGLNLCPFARRVLISNQLHLQVSDAVTQEQLLVDLQLALEELGENQTIETTLLIHPEVLQDFAEYNQFLDYADALLRQLNLEGVYQIASFHPDYQFAGTQPEDVRNYSNKSPYPMLHILAEDSIETALANYPDSELIPVRNQELLQQLGIEKIKALLNE